MSRKLKWVVTSAKWNKTIVVTVSTRKTHSKYKKQYTVSTKYHAHDEKNSCQEWQEVVIFACAPISKFKKYTVSA